MRVSRHKRLRTRLALLAITALLWSQIVLALHADCLSLPMGDPLSSAVVEHSECADSGNAAERLVCALHCGQGEANSDGSRIPPIAPLGTMAMVPVVDVMHLPPPRHADADLTFHGSWHRPTLNPASVLLI